MFQHTQANGLKEGGGKSSYRKEEEDDLFWPHRTACGILVPRPGIEPVTPAVEVPSPNHWSTREVPRRISKDVQVLATWVGAPACPRVADPLVLQGSLDYTSPETTSKPYSQLVASVCLPQPER